VNLAGAPEDIGRRIEAIQVDTPGAVSAIRGISTIVGRVNDNQTTIASAVEEQTASTNEMSRSVAEAASGSTSIAGTITADDAADDVTTTGVGQARQATAELARMSSELQVVAGRFRC
jgi:methyl-accepting chemotaxis protein